MNRHPFDLLMELPPSDIRLDCAALHLARDAYPHLDLPSYLARLDGLAAEVADERPGLSATLRYECLRRVLVKRHGFTGNSKRYEDPRNCYLNRVLDRKIGLPITISIVWIEVARRLKWPLLGVGFPGHFLVRLDDRDQFVLIDPFNGGVSLDADALRVLRRAVSGAPEPGPADLKPVETIDIIVRLLNNLRRFYLERADLKRLARVLERLHAADPSQGQHLQDLAAVHCRQGDMQAAHACLAAYVSRQPEASDLPQVQTNLTRLEAAMLARN